RGADRQPGQHHRGRPRRHQPLRGPGQCDRDADRSAHRELHPKRPDAPRRRFHLPGADHGHPGHRRGRRRPADAKEVEMSTATTTTNGAPVLEARGLVKRYGQVTAMDGWDFEVRAGEILAVIGDNGAGKSTLIKALSGAIIPDEGMIFLDGEEVNFHGPLDARRQGIETVYQDLAVAPALTIAENLFLGREVRRSGVLGKWLRMLAKR